MVKHVSINTEINMNNINGVNYDDERDYGTDDTRWIQVGNGPKRKTSKRQNYYQTINKSQSQTDLPHYDPYRNQMLVTRKMTRTHKRSQ